MRFNLDNCSLRTKATLVSFFIFSLTTLLYVFVFNIQFVMLQNTSFTDHIVLSKIEDKVIALDNQMTTLELDELRQLAQNYQLRVKETYSETNSSHYQVADLIYAETEKLISKSSEYIKADAEANAPLKQQIDNQLNRLKLSLITLLRNKLALVEQEAGKGLKRVFYYEIISSFIFFGIMMLLITYMIGSLLKPLNKLRDDIEQFQDLDIKTEKGDEIKLLIRSFNNMRKEINNKQELSVHALLKAKQANVAKSEFLANISHELRTPMLGILGFAELGVTKIDHIDKAKLLKYFDRIYTSGSRLLLLLNNLLDLSKLEAGKMKFEYTTYSINKILETVLTELDSLIKSHHLTVKVKCLQDNIEAEVDSNKIHQVVYNLISNAIKFSPEHGVITISMLDNFKSSENQPASIKFIVSDQGLGVPEDEYKYIFEKFSQSSKTNTGAGGTGLGLSICHDICKCHNGNIWVVNTLPPLQGANFMFTLPKIHQEAHSPISN